MSTFPRTHAQLTGQDSTQNASDADYRDYDAMAQAILYARGIPATFVVYTDGTYWYATNAMGVLTYGGPSGVGSVSGSAPTPVIQAALNALSGTYKQKVTVVGNVTIAATVTLPSYCILEVDGTWTLANSVNGHMVTNASLSGGNSCIDVIGGYFNGNYTNQITGDIIHFEKCTNCRIFDCTFTLAKGSEICFGNSSGSGQKCYYCQVSNCNFILSYAYGIYDYNSWGNEYVGNSFANVNYGIYLNDTYQSAIGGNTFSYMTNAGIYIANTYESVISGNTMAVYGAIGIQATGTTLNSLCIVGNHIDTASQQAVYLNCTGVGNIITGNTFSDNGYTSSGPTYYPDITVGSGTGLLNTVVVGNNFRHFPSGPWYASINIQVYGNQTTVIGNTMDYAQTDGIDLNGCSNCIVKGNIIQNCSAYAIKELNSANYNSIEGNTLVSVTNTILKVGSATVIRNNVGYATESSGSSTGTGSQQSIAHGLVAVPTSVSIVPTASGATVSFAYADATNIYVTVTSGTAFNWRASV